MGRMKRTNTRREENETIAIGRKRRMTMKRTTTIRRRRGRRGRWV